MPSGRYTVAELKKMSTDGLLNLLEEIATDWAEDKRLGRSIPKYRIQERTRVRELIKKRAS